MSYVSCWEVAIQDGHLPTLINLYPDALWDHDILQRDGIMQRIVQFIGLAHPRRSDCVHDLGDRVWIYHAMRIHARSRAHTERVWARGRSEGTCLIWLETVLTGQRHCEAPARPWLPTQARRWHTERDKARDGVGTDRH